MPSIEWCNSHNHFIRHISVLLQMSKINHRKVEELAWSHTASKWQNLRLESRQSGSRAHAFNHKTETLPPWNLSPGRIQTINRKTNKEKQTNKGELGCGRTVKGTNKEMKDNGLLHRVIRGVTSKLRQEGWEGISQEMRKYSGQGEASECSSNLEGPEKVTVLVISGGVGQSRRTPECLEETLYHRQSSSSWWDTIFLGVWGVWMDGMYVRGSKESRVGDESQRSIRETANPHESWRHWDQGWSVPCILDDLCLYLPMGAAPLSHQGNWQCVICRWVKSWIASYRHWCLTLPPKPNSSCPHGHQEWREQPGLKGKWGNKRCLRGNFV